MEYKVLYRKYRPCNFETIVGQNHTKKMLQNAIINNKISHAYLFTGPRGTGKTSTAKVFAKTINCLNVLNGEACGKCQNCLDFAHSSDVIEIDAASNNGVDDIRELINNVKIAPSEGKYKIYIIDEVHMLTQSAFNALLLTLEEPPSHAIFIMATTNVESVPITILSRCQRFNFQKISLGDIITQLRNICEKENISVTDDAIMEIAYLSEGGLRDALSLLDQLSSENDEITLDSVVSNYGSISLIFIKRLLENMEKGDISSIVSQMSELISSSSDYKIFIKKLIMELVNKSVACKIDNNVTRFTYEQLKNLIFDLNECMNKVSIHLNPYFLVQTILLNYVSTNKNTSENNNNKEVIKKEEINLDKSKSESVVESKILNKSDNSNYETKLDNNNFNMSNVEDFEEEMSEFLEELKNIRINNCFATAKKDLLLNYQQKFRQIMIDKSLSRELNSLLLDVNIVAAGEKAIIIVTPLESSANLINKVLEQLDSEMSNIWGYKVAFIAISEGEWNNLKKEYVQNIKNGVKYEVIEEDFLEELKPKQDSALESFASEIFDDSKIEIV